jgi:hypothetical protein
MTEISRSGSCGSGHDRSALPAAVARGALRRAAQPVNCEGPLRGCSTPRPLRAAAGTACALVSLCPVDAAATALLMVKVYEQMMNRGSSPPEASRRGQLWLREPNRG